MQSTSNILMVRPAQFGFNPETALTNVHMKQSERLSSDEINTMAKAEFDQLVEQLRSRDIAVTVIDDSPEPIKPDAIFPNNWVSFHANSTVRLYPMHAPNRRLERRPEIIEQLGTKFQITEVIDYSHFEQDGLFLESTGSMVLDRQRKVIYACLSPRTHQAVLDLMVEESGFELEAFHAYELDGSLIYHTNVLMCISYDFGVICLDAIKDTASRKRLTDRFERSGIECISISHAQMNAFAGNMLQLHSRGGDRILVMSQSAYDCLEPDQIRRLEAHTEILSSPIPAIEHIAGGSVRCMIAEIFCPLI